jgi:hypothetical protein
MDQYKTQNLYEAGALIASGERIVGMETSSRPYTFIFEDFEVCSKKALQYINNELAVLAKDYADAIKTLKSRVNTQ